MRLAFILILAMAGFELCGQTISADRLRAHVKFLSSDLLEGRAPGTRGGQLTTEYLAAQFALAGADPVAGSDSYLQPVPSVSSHNVIAMVPGRDAQLRSETVLYIAHWDQLGLGPEVNGDGIYNGALDNATGVAVLIELARAWASLKTRPARSAVFLAATAGESGVLGSQHYVEDPIVPLDTTAVVINFDTYEPFGIPESLDIGAAEDTPVWQQAQDAARRLGLTVHSSKDSSLDACCQSDDEVFSRAGLSALSIRMAGGFAGKDAVWLQALREKNGYAQPTDEYREEWDFSGLALVGEYGFLLGRMIAALD